MQVHIAMSGFRCFSDIGPVRLAPITILVGENSTGKTSFLAGVRQLLEAFQASSSNSFNREPYFLGSFEQIAHYRGGKAGRVKSFGLSISLSPDDTTGDLFSVNRPFRPATTHRFSFRKGQTQPELSTYRVDNRGIEADFDLTGGRPRIAIKRGDQMIIQIDPERAPPAALMRREASYLGYYLQDLLFRAGASGNDLTEGQNDAVKSLNAAFRSASRYLRHDVFASAPVRIQPRRVYTPSELTSAIAGEQIPLEIANQKLLSPAKWKETKAKLIDFGTRSGLFQDIEVKRFGKSDSDPFQLQIKNHGPAANIVDVGYGVSQALPLLYPLQNDSDYGAFLLQQPEVHLHPRAQAEFGSLISTLSKQNPSKMYVIETHSDFIIDRIRTEIREGTISASSLSILYFSKTGLDVDVREIKVGDDGSIKDPPPGYRDFFLREQARALGV